MPDTPIRTFTSKHRVSVSSSAAWFFLICCAVLVGTGLLPWLMEIFVLHYSDPTWSIPAYTDLVIFEASFVIAAYPIWLESRQAGNAPPRPLPIRPAGIRLFAIFQGAIMAIMFLGIVIHTVISGLSPPSTSRHLIPPPWWEELSINLWATAFGCVAAFLGYYAWNGSKGARDAVVILSAAQVLYLLIWWALWLAGIIPPPRNYDPIWDSPFSPKFEWLPVVWSAVCIWYFGISGARKFYAA